jgi:hypothetical protein
MVKNAGVRGKDKNLFPFFKKMAHNRFCPDIIAKSFVANNNFLHDLFDRG